MLRALGVNLERAFVLWRMFYLQADKAAAKAAKRNVSAANLGNVLDKKRRNHLRAGVRPLAKGVANTKMQTKIFNRLHFIAFGKLKNAFMTWKEKVNFYKNISVLPPLCVSSAYISYKRSISLCVGHHNSSLCLGQIEKRLYLPCMRALITNLGINASFAVWPTASQVSMGRSAFHYISSSLYLGQIEAVSTRLVMVHWLGIDASEELLDMS
jgi:hypothetical protein